MRMQVLFQIWSIYVFDIIMYLELRQYLNTVKVMDVSLTSFKYYPKYWKWGLASLSKEIQCLQPQSCLGTEYSYHATCEFSSFREPPDGAKEFGLCQIRIYIWKEVCVAAEQLRSFKFAEVISLTLKYKMFFKKR
jgi:hypothetical protein